MDRVMYQLGDLLTLMVLNRHLCITIQARCDKIPTCCYFQKV